MSEKYYQLKIKGIIDEEKEVPVSKYKNFAELVKDYTEKTQGILSEININDKNIPINYFEKLKTSFFEGGEKLILEFSPKSKILKNLSLQSIEYIHKIKENLEKIPTNVLLEREDGHKMLNSVSEGIKALLNIVSQVKEYLEEEFYVKEDLEKINNVIKQIDDFKIDKDFDKIKSLIEYDLTISLKILEKIFMLAIDNLEKKE